MGREIRTKCFNEHGTTVCKTLDCLQACFSTNQDGMGVDVCEHYRIELPKPDWWEPSRQKEWCDK